MNRKLFQASFTDDEDMPPWPCPTCESGVLTLSEESLHIRVDAQTLRDQNEFYFEADSSKYVFTALSGCNLCKEPVIISGIGDIDQREERNEEGQWETTYEQNLYPRYFVPALKIIQLPDNGKIPSEIVEILVSSYPLFWLDLNACANRLRSTLELLLDQMEVPRRIKPDAKSEMTLHDRITKIDPLKHPDMALLIEATKLVGNEGSHRLGQLSRNEVLDCYEMLEFCLQKLYPGPDLTPRMHAIAQNLITKWEKRN